MHGLLPLTCAIALSIFLGCGGPSDPLNRQAVTGSVTFQGKPLDHGSISLETQDSAHGTSGGAVIENGQFSIAKKRGLPPGSYTVRISSPDMKTMVLPEGEAPGDVTRLPKERIPAAWNSKSDQTLTVEADGDNHFELTIP